MHSKPGSDEPHTHARRTHARKEQEEGGREFLQVARAARRIVVLHSFTHGILSEVFQAHSPAHPST
jgi:hypothetical protein